MSHRPTRRTVTPELGGRLSLAGGPDAFQALGGGGVPLLLGLGPEPRQAPVGTDEPALFVESEAFAAQMDEQTDGEWSHSIPTAWRKLQPADLTPGLVRSSAILLYRQNPRLFPSFWGPVLARCRLLLAGQSEMGGTAAHARTNNVLLLPGTNRGLLIRELEDTFSRLGFAVRRTPPAASPDDLARMLAEDRPELFLSVNFQGLDPFGETFHLLRSAGVRVAAWLVDNPFHLLSGLKSPFWRDMDLFVTDEWFVRPLQRHGAARVHHLPLAAWPGLYERSNDPARQESAGIEERVVFVGRLEFPAKREFFSGLTPPPGLMTEARDMLEAGARPDFGWWVDRLGLSQAEALWPGRAVRTAGLGAEEAGRAWRIRCVREAAERMPVTVFGGEAWRAALPECTDVRDEIDYYGPLAAIYGRARYVLGLTSPLLPCGLTQRHFDVWSCGGFLLTDRTPGLSLFPAELVGPVAFDRPSEIAALADRLERDPSMRRDLRAAWTDLVIEHHSYVRRMEALLAVLTVE